MVDSNLMFGPHRIYIPLGYPFDEYKSGLFAMTGSYLEHDNTRRPVNLLLSIVGAVHAWSVQVPLLLDTSVYKDGTYLIAEISVSRALTTKVRLIAETKNYSNSIKLFAVFIFASECSFVKTKSYSSSSHVGVIPFDVRSCGFYLYARP